MPETLKVDGKMNVHIISPTKSVLDGVADKVLLPTPYGNIMILKDRAPLFTATSSGIMWVYNEGVKPVAYFISGGIAEIRRNICSVLAWGVKADEINKERLHSWRLNLEGELPKIHSKMQKKQALERIDFLKMLETRPSLLVPPDFE
ncbi:MAG: F0F1 ATP synthase subunit epsilon [Alphaproteobacteria bacterium]|nr:F0F1 ATP synthase subunit epsilon [Alphaproteobacteria bacterium]